MGSTGSARRRKGRISRSGDFQRAYRDGSSRANRYLVVYAFARDGGADDQQRLGVSVGRKVGGAVDRNRVKRVIREAFWSVAEQLPAGHDFVIVARAEAATAIAEESLEQTAAEIAALAAEAAAP